MNTIRNASEGFTFSFLEYLPEGYGDGKKYPLVIFLHGLGERANAEGTNILDVAINGLPKHTANGTEYPFILISPQCPYDKIWSAQIESLNKFLDEIINAYSVDTDRIILTGLSMGGYGTWTWGEANPERFAALVPVCGGGICWYAGNLANKPIWAFHGEADTCVPVTESIQMVQRIRDCGGNPKFTIYPGVGHGSWEPAYKEPELIPWMMEQHL